ncbi:hypothetical protein TNCV_1332561 [Trichonephila clavipes]|nr:hypothetical protein TNCV_1332561 [Trichonephila clavipes]
MKQGYNAQKLSKSFYIDNCVTSVDNERELVDFVKCSTKFLADAKMDLRLWTYGKVVEVEMLACGAGWDTSLTENVKRKFLKWYNGLEVLKELKKHGACYLEIESSGRFMYSVMLASTLTPP